MDHALILLLRLRFWGFLRRAGRKMATVRGLLLAALGLCVFLPAIVSALLVPAPARFAAAQVEGFRRAAPPGMLAYCLLTLLFSPGEKAFAFTPAEVSFLFPAPFSRRKLLAYKIGGNLGLVVLSGLFFTFAFRQYSPTWLGGYLGVVLVFSFIQLFAMAVTLAGQAIGEHASTWRRRLALVLIVALAGTVAVSAGWRTLGDLPPMEALARLENAPVTRAVLAPFRPFAYTITAERLWPEAITWAGVALAVDALLIAAIFSLDTQYLEAAAAGSERLYAKMERMRKGGPVLTFRRKNAVWKEIPALPWWGGIGPILWRQFTAAGRDYLRILTPILLGFTLAGVGIFIGARQQAQDATVLPMVFGGIIFGYGSFFLSLLLNFDFRGDLDRMEELKTLPISPSRLALGQIATPMIVLTTAQVAALVVLAAGTWPVLPTYWAYVAFALPLNVILLEVENLMFLWFPSRPMAHTPGDVQAMGRMMLIMLAIGLVVTISGGLAAGFGLLGYLIGGWIAAAVVAWLVLAGISALFVPMIAMAFRNFDVASDMPA